jgi:Tfp pilus assembly protein PilF
MLGKKIQKLFLLAAVGSMVSACSSEVDLNKLHADFQEKPQGYDQLMAAANHARQRGQNEQAKQWYKEALGTAEATGGSDDPRIANAALGDAGVAKDQGQFGEAEQMLKRAYEIQKKTLPPTSPEFQQTKKEYAIVLLINYKAEEAKKIDPNAKLPGAQTSSKRPVRKKH